MTTAAYDVGDTKRMSVAFANFAGAPTDPTAVSLIIREPDGTETEETHNPGNIVRDSAGNYRFDFAITKPGRHVERWVGTGAVAVAETVEFWARRKQVAS